MTWTALQIMTQVAGELGLSRPTDVADTSDKQSVQLLALMNAAGNELLNYHTWEFLREEWSITTAGSAASYPLPADYSYFLDQTQWDRSNRWPLLGPKSAQEWAWMKGAQVASLPRTRWRLRGREFLIHPVPADGLTFTMEYIKKNWLMLSDGVTEGSMIVDNDDTVQYDEWLMIKFTKLKFYELKGFPTSSVQADFVRVFDTLTGKDTGAPILSMAPVVVQPYIGAHSIPDGSWST